MSEEIYKDNSFGFKILKLMESWYNREMTLQEVKDKANSLFCQATDEIIGKDESMEEYAKEGGLVEDVPHRNALRSEQRECRDEIIK